MTKHRPLGITILALLVALAAIVSIYHTLQFLHILPFTLGPVRFFAFDLLGAILWGIDAAILIWVFTSLWNLNPQGWLFVLVIAVLNLILAFMSILGDSSFQAMLPAILINVIILLYCLSPGVKAAFTEPAKPVAAVAAPAAMRTMQAPAQAPAVAPPVRSAAVPLEVSAVEPAAPPPVVIPAEAPAAPPPGVIPAEEPAASAPEVIPAEEPAASAPIVIPAEEPAASPLVEESPAAAPVMKEPRLRPKVDVESIEGIGPVYAAKLKEIGILTTADLLREGASRKDREDLVEKTGVSSTLILKWVNMADLLRISGVGEEYSELLEAAGVDTVKELKNRNPDNLYQAMIQVNEEKHLVRRTPHQNDVRDWVEQAKELEAVLTY